MPRSLTGLTPRQEQAFNERAQAIAARRMETALFRETLRATRAFALAWDEPLKQETAMAEHREAMQAILSREYSRAFDVFGQRMIDAAGKAHAGRFEKKDADSFFVGLARAWIVARVAEKVTSIVNTTRKQAMGIIRRATDQGVADGLGTAGVGRLIADSLASQGAQIARVRANTIARTEVHSAANAAAHEAVRSTGLPVLKQWIAAIDGRERESHAEADREYADGIPINQPFIVDGEALDYPGDASGSAANIIGCRCQVAHIVAD